MVTNKVYEIVSVQPQIYLNSGIAVQGYLVKAKWLNYDETVDVNVPSIDKDVVNTRLLDLYKQRIALDELGHMG